MHLVTLLALCLNTSFASENSLMVGVAAKDITPPIGVPLGGFGGGDRRMIPDVFDRHPYAMFMTPSEGIMDPIRAKAMVLDNGTSKLLFVSLDVVGITRDVVEDLINRVHSWGFHRDNVFVGATHTHSGPGTLARNLVWQLLVMDLFKKNVYNDFIDNVSNTVLDAIARMEPAELLSGSFEAQGLQENRRQDREYFDADTHLLLARNMEGHWLGGIANMSIHGTALGDWNQLYSADVMGHMERELQGRLDSLNIMTDAAPVTIGFFNGAVGDVRPRHGHEEGMTRIGLEFADQAMDALGTLRKLEPEWEVKFRDVKVGFGGLNLQSCVGKGWWTTLLKWRLPIGFWMPKDAPIWSIRIDDLRMMTWPGEPTTSLGLALRDAADKAGDGQSMVLGLTNDYMAYFTNSEEYYGNGYEACNSLYTDEGGEKIVDAHARLMLSQEPSP